MLIIGYMVFYITNAQKCRCIVERESYAGKIYRITVVALTYRSCDEVCAEEGGWTEDRFMENYTQNGSELPDWVPDLSDVPPFE